MKYLFIILIAVFSVVFTESIVAQSDNRNDTGAFLSKEQIVEKLKNLPRKYSAYIGRMCNCYTPRSVSYICQKCGRKTVYGETVHSFSSWDWLMSIGKQEFVQNNNGYFEPKFLAVEPSKNEVLRKVVHEIPNCRKIVKQIKGIHIALDETEFCEHCSFDISNPTLHLSTIINGDTTKTSNISLHDIEILEEFINNNTISCTSGWGCLEDILAEIKRLTELLGIKNELIE